MLKSLFLFSSSKKVMEMRGRLSYLLAGMWSSTWLLRIMTWQNSSPWPHRLGSPSLINYVLPTSAPGLCRRPGKGEVRKDSQRDNPMAMPLCMGGNGFLRVSGPPLPSLVNTPPPIWSLCINYPAISQKGIGWNVKIRAWNLPWDSWVVRTGPRA